MIEIPSSSALRCGPKEVRICLGIAHTRNLLQAVVQRLAELARMLTAALFAALFTVRDFDAVEH
jgi:hypothetical protein